MSISVTGNVSSVTDVVALLSNLGFDTGSSDAVSEVVIERFDHWTNRTDARVLICSSAFDVALMAA
jgi:hypothetical protein